MVPNGRWAWYSIKDDEIIKVCSSGIYLGIQDNYRIEVVKCNGPSVQDYMKNDTFDKPKKIKPKVTAKGIFSYCCAKKVEDEKKIYLI
jgi:hypothetical protein